MTRVQLSSLYRSFRRKTFGILLILFGLLLAFPIVTYAYFARDITDPERLMNRNNTGISLRDRKGEVFYTQGRLHAQDEAKLSGISDHLEKALIASEDKNFYHHSGYSLKNIAGAIYGNLINKSATQYGGSTITQQLIKNNVLTADKSLLRKYQELSLAIAADKHYSKEKILEMYLNSVYFGEGAFGISSAAKTYFNKTPDKLTLAESSMLIGILPAPGAHSPVSGNPAMAKKQQSRVLGKMVEEGYINGEEKITALRQELTYAEPTGTNNNKHAQHFAYMVLDELHNRYGEEMITRSGFDVTTSLDMDLQKVAEAQAQKRIAELANQGGTNAGVVAIDPRSGEIRALVGSVDWNNPKFGKVNVALAPRQPGSSFKPIVFAEALDKRVITPATVLHDAPRSFGGWRPQNHDLRFMGNMSVRKALALSRNPTAIEVLEKIGPQEAARAAQRMGISTVNEPERYGLTMALGTAETRLLDLTNAYAAFAAGGNQQKATTVVSIKDKFNKNVYRNPKKPKRVQSAEASFLVNSILSDAEARSPTFNSMTIPGRPVAVKTGTTDENRNAWTLGYAPSIAVGVWVGNNENRPMSGVAGGAGAGPIWRGTIEHALKDTPPEQFAQPTTVERVAICNTGGPALQAGPEFVIAGSIPAQTCGTAPPANRPEPPKEEPRKRPEEEPRREEPQNNGGRGSGPGNNNQDRPPTPPPPGNSPPPPPANNPAPPPPPSPEPTPPPPPPSPEPTPPPPPPSPEPTPPSPEPTPPPPPPDDNPPPSP